MKYIRARHNCQWEGETYYFYFPATEDSKAAFTELQSRHEYDDEYSFDLKERDFPNEELDDSRYMRKHSLVVDINWEEILNAEDPFYKGCGLNLAHRQEMMNE